MQIFYYICFTAFFNSNFLPFTIEFEKRDTNDYAMYVPTKYRYPTFVKKKREKKQLNIKKTFYTSLPRVFDRRFFRISGLYE